MLPVYLTIDVEVWCDTWNALEVGFLDGFKRHILGRTARGDFGLPFKLKVLQEHGLRGVFFTEPLFAARFGLEPLREIVEAIRLCDQEIQLHLHTEWVDEAIQPLLSPMYFGKRQFLRQFTCDEQAQLIGAGMRILSAAGAPTPNAFRAGSFGFNRDTLTAVRANGLYFDSSYNGATSGRLSGVMPERLMTAPAVIDGVCEYPMTVFADGTGRVRPAQITACSRGELEALLWQALEQRRSTFVILSHSFELLNRKRQSPDPVAVDRYVWLCEFLDRNRDCFRTAGFTTADSIDQNPQPVPLVSPLWRTSLRYAEQAMRWRFG